MIPLYASILASTGGIWSTLQNVTGEIIGDKLGGFQSIAVVLAAMLAAFTVLKNSSDYIQGESRFLWPVMRPVVILVCVMHFPVMCGMLDGVINIFTREIAAESESSFSDLGEAIEGAFSSIGEDTESQADEADGDAADGDWSFWNRLKTGFRIAAGSYFKTKQISTLTVLTFIGRALAEIILFVYEILASLYLGLLKLLGPIILAISIPEELKNGVQGWVSRYVQISLWIPVGYVIIMFLTGYFRAICDLIISGGFMSGAFVIGLGLIIAVVAATMSIPKLASWTIQSSGSVNAQSGMERSMMGILRKFIK